MSESSSDGGVSDLQPQINIKIKIKLLSPYSYQIVAENLKCD